MEESVVITPQSYPLYVSFIEDLDNPYAMRNRGDLDALQTLAEYGEDDLGVAVYTVVAWAHDVQHLRGTPVPIVAGYPNNWETPDRYRVGTTEELRKWGYDAVKSHRDTARRMCEERGIEWIDPDAG